LQLPRPGGCESGQTDRQACERECERHAVLAQCIALSLLDIRERRYWGVYGQLLYTYSYYSDKYSHTHNASDLAAVRALILAAAESAGRGRQPRNIGALATPVIPLISRNTALHPNARPAHTPP